MHTMIARRVAVLAGSLLCLSLSAVSANAQGPGYYIPPPGAGAPYQGPAHYGAPQYQQPHGYPTQQPQPHVTYQPVPQSYQPHHPPAVHHTPCSSPGCNTGVCPHTGRPLPSTGHQPHYTQHQPSYSQPHYPSHAGGCGATPCVEPGDYGHQHGYRPVVKHYPRRYHSPRPHHQSSCGSNCGHGNLGHIPVRPRWEKESYWEQHNAYWGAIQKQQEQFQGQ